MWRWKPSRATNMITGLKTSSKDWATGYDFPALKNGRCIKEEIIPQAG